ncbi:MAG: hypothetical protein HC798_03365 [Polaribacter sp.]|nr:hypothetical protein [Polaribacter sp.]
MQIGYAIDSTLYNGDKAYINSIFDVKTLVENILDKSDNKIVEEFNEGFVKGFNNKFDFGTLILNELNEDTNYDFITYFYEDETYFLTFRLFSEDGLNYHEYKLVKENDVYKIVDVYFYLSGEYFSETLQGIYFQSLNGVLNSENNSYSNPFTEDLIKLSLVKKQMQKGDYIKAKEIFDSISEKSQLQKPFLIIALLITSNLDEKLYINYIQKYETNYPNDPSLYLVSLDGYVLKGEYKKALELVDLLDESVGGDNFLDLQRSGLHLLDKNYEQALVYGKKLLENYPNYIDAYVNMITINIEYGKDADAIDAIEIFMKQFELDKETMKVAFEEDYPEFVKKQVYKDWFKKED